MDTDTKLFSKNFRLLNSSQYQKVFSDSKFKHANDYILLLATPNSLTYSRLGLIIPKKKVKRAVDRNRFKRLIRESFRARQGDRPGLDIIALARSNPAHLEAKAQSDLINKSFDDFFTKVSTKIANE